VEGNAWVLLDLGWCMFYGVGEYSGLYVSASYYWGNWRFVSSSTGSGGVILLIDVSSLLDRLNMRKRRVGMSMAGGGRNELMLCAFVIVMRDAKRCHEASVGIWDASR
jgi:hypothetical protein